MSDRWKVTVEPPPEVETSEVEGITFGPFGDVLPERFIGRVEGTERPLRMTLVVSFDGADRVKVERVTVERTDGETVTSEDMSALQLAAVVGNVGHKAMRYGPGPVAGGGRQQSGPPSADELRLLARMYWQDYVTWGSPRQSVMAAFGLPRSTANRWIRKARDLYGLPGVHAGEGG